MVLGFLSTMTRYGEQEPELLGNRCHRKSRQDQHWSSGSGLLSLQRPGQSPLQAGIKGAAVYVVLLVVAGAAVATVAPGITNAIARSTVVTTEVDALRVDFSPAEAVWKVFIVLSFPVLALAALPINPR